MSDKDINQLSDEINEKYAKTFSLLLSYDNGNIPDRIVTENTDIFKKGIFNVNLAYAHINLLKLTLINMGKTNKSFGTLVNRDSFQEIIGFLKENLTVYDRAAKLFYEIIKIRPFNKGNKIIASSLALYYIKLHDLPIDIDSHGLVALAILTSYSQEKDRDKTIELISYVF
jgi:prophage maintenance system killer protein